MRITAHCVCAITGAGSGIGRALALALAKKGCSLSLSDVNEVGLQATAELCQITTNHVMTSRVDVADKAQIEQWAHSTLARFGKIDILINNAGVALGCPVEDMQDEDFKWVMDINFWGMVHGTQIFLPLIKQTSNEGHIVNLSSLFGLVAQPTQSAYNASKYAIRGYTECLQMELAMEKSPVGLTSVHPGGIKTNVANSARISPALSRLGIDPNTAKDNFNQFLVTLPEQAANQIIRAVERKQKRLLIGYDAKIIDMMQRWLPTGYQWFTRKFVEYSAKNPPKP